MPIQVTKDLTDEGKLKLSPVTSAYIDRLLMETLNDEVSESVRRAALRELRRPQTKKLIAAAAVRKLTQMLRQTATEPETPAREDSSGKASA